MLTTQHRQQIHLTTAQVVVLIWFTIVIILCSGEPDLLDHITDMPVQCEVSE